MIYTLSSQYLSVRVDSLGAQLRSVKSPGGTEYLWQGDKRYWEDSSPLLFPYIARLYGGGYTYRGRRYNMGIHGFAAQCEFVAEDVRDDSVTLVLRESGYTLSQYPFQFELRVRFSLSGRRLTVGHRVRNLDEKPMPFALGGHPGINIPLYGGTEFEDYYLSFNAPCEPWQIGFTDELFLSGEDRPYPLEDGRIIRLRHELFDDDALVLRGAAEAVTLGCGGREILTMGFSGFDYFGLWHAPKTEAPYVCLERWTSLPSRQGVVEELTEKADMLSLEAGECFENNWFLEILEEK